MSRRIAIMQPTYLPWLGYFAMMAEVDEFVILDSVQFARRSWQQRNRIKNGAGEQMLTIPVLKKGKRDQLICEVEIDRERDFVRKHKASISSAYKRAPFFNDHAQSIFEILMRDHSKLSALTIDLIEYVKNTLEISCKLTRSSQLQAKGTKAELLANICRELDASVYLSAVGSKAYIDETTIFQDSGIDVVYSHYEHPQYDQLFGQFIPFMSVVDLLFNEGPESLRVIRSGAVNPSGVHQS